MLDITNISYLNLFLSCLESTRVGAFLYSSGYYRFYLGDVASLRLRDKLVAKGLAVVYGLSLLDLWLTHIAVSSGFLENNPFFTGFNWVGGVTLFGVFCKVVLLGLGLGAFGALYFKWGEDLGDFFRFLGACAVTWLILLYLWVDIQNLLLLLG